MSFDRKRNALLASAVIVFMMSNSAMAADAADPLAQAAVFMNQAVVLLLGGISALIFVIAAYGVIVKLAGAVSGRGDWGGVVMPFVVGAISAMFVGYLYTQGITAAEQITTASVQELVIQVERMA